MTLTFTVPMPIDSRIRRGSDAKRYGCRSSSMRRRNAGFTLTELIIVVALVSLFAAMAQLNIFGVLRKGTFRSQAQELISTLQMAVSAAAESDRRYEVIIDISEQTYVLREITSNELLSDVLEEEIIVSNEFGDNCQVDYVLFDDLIETGENNVAASFRAGRVGWQNAGKIVLLDSDGQPYTVLVNRINRTITLQKGDVEILMPKREDDIPF